MEWKKQQKELRTASPTGYGGTQHHTDHWTSSPTGTHQIKSKCVEAQEKPKLDK